MWFVNGGPARVTDPMRPSPVPVKIRIRSGLPAQVLTPAGSSGKLPLRRALSSRVGCRRGAAPKVAGHTIRTDRRGLAGSPDRRRRTGGSGCRPGGGCSKRSSDGCRALRPSPRPADRAHGAGQVRQSGHFRAAPPAPSPTVTGLGSPPAGRPRERPSRASIPQLWRSFRALGALTAATAGPRPALGRSPQPCYPDSAAPPGGSPHRKCSAGPAAPPGPRCSCS